MRTRSLLLILCLVGCGEQPSAGTRNSRSAASSSAGSKPAPLPVPSAQPKTAPASNPTTAPVSKPARSPKLSASPAGKPLPPARPTRNKEPAVDPGPKAKPAPTPDLERELIAQSARLCAAGKHTEALAVALKAITLAADSPEGYLAAGLARARMGRLDEAREDCDAAIQRAPKLARAYFNRGNVWIMGKALNKAFADFTQALALDPKHLGAWANRGSVRALKGDLDGAIADYTAALKVDPDYVQGYINRASAYARKRDLERVETDLERAAALVAKLPGREAEVTRSRIAAMRRSIGRLWLRRLLKVRSVEELAPFLELRDVEVRRTGYKLLLGLAHKEDRALALAGLRDPDKFVRTYAVAVLAKIGDSESVPAMLARMTTDNEEAVRGAIVMAVVRLGRLEQVIQPLVDQLAREKSTYVVEVLDRCLRGLTQVEPQVTVDLARLEPGRSKLVAFWNSWWKARAKEKR